MSQNENQGSVQYPFTLKQKRYLPIKRIIDVALSGSAIVLLAPLLGIISLVIKLESPGPVLFKQKRVGKNGELFDIWKFRSMRTDTPKDMPTHMLDNPEQYITKSGKFIRKTSLDELPQIFNIFRGQMSIIGPRPALWNQYDLIEERDKYGANSVMPGLTGWAQINGRDELEIPVKAKLDGEYVERMGFGMDVKCFFGTIGSVLSSDGVVEGGTGEMKKDDAQVNDETKRTDKVKKEICAGAVIVVAVVSFICGLMKRRKKKECYMPKKHAVKKIAMAAIVAEGIATVYVNIKRRVQSADHFVEDEPVVEVPVEHDAAIKKILITGAGSYIGEAVEKWLMKKPERYSVTTVDMLTEAWKETDFSCYDVVYHVAGIAHADIGSVTEERKQLYYKVNTELAVEVAEYAKEAGVKQFIFMSSMIVYSGCKEKVISRETRPNPLNFYGDSKWQAEQKIRDMEDKSFKVVILRPPMIYGKGSKGNYPELAKLAGELPIFPIVNNKRSMLHIDNLCEFVKLMIDHEESGIFFPQNREYTNTSDMVQMIAEVKGHRIIMIPGLNLAIKILERTPGKIGTLAGKAFGDSVYEMSMSEYKVEYRVNSLRKSIELTEGR